MSNHMANRSVCIPVIIKNIATMVLVAATGPDMSRNRNRNKPNNHPMKEKVIPEK